MESRDWIEFIAKGYQAVVPVAIGQREKADVLLIAGNGRSITEIQF